MAAAPATLRPAREPAAARATWRRGAPVLLVAVPAAGGAALGHLLLPGDRATPAAVAFLVRFSGGLVHAAMTAARLDDLDIPPMVTGRWRDPRCAEGVSVDARHGTTTGISAADRAATLRTLADPASRPADLVRPGHVFPVRACDPPAAGGAAEAAIALATQCDHEPVVAMATLVDDAGALVTGDAISAFGRDHQLPIVAVRP